VFVEPEWLPPLPPPIEAYCGDEDKLSEPIIAYRISPTCTLSEIRAVGEYQFGTEHVRSVVNGFSTDSMESRFISGSMVHFKQISIELHRTYEAPATLVCTVDMMGKKVIDAKIVQERVLNETRTVKYEEPVAVLDNLLTDLGVYTYSEPVYYSVNSCPD